MQKVYPTSKTCSKCHEDKPLAFFSTQKRGLYGRESQCKDCRKPIPERSREYSRRHRARNPDPHRCRISNARHYARRYGAAINDFTREQWIESLAYFQGRCAYCQAESDALEVEHMTPLSRGGNNTASNIVPACRSCNNHKQRLSLVGWLRKLQG